MENPQDNLIPDSKELLQFLELNNLSEDQQKQVLENLLHHLSEVVVECLLDNLSIEHAADIKKMMQENPSKIQQRIRELSSRTPGLYVKIQLAIKQELEILKSGYSQALKA